MERILEGHEISINYLAEEHSPSSSGPGGEGQKAAVKEAAEDMGTRGVLELCNSRYITNFLPS